MRYGTWETPVDFSVEHHINGDVGVVEVRGELDVETVEVLADAVEAVLTRTDRVVVDLWATTFVDCRGLSMLLSLERQVRERGGRLRAAGACPVVELLMTTFQVEEALGGLRSVEEEVRTVLDSQSAVLR